MTDWTSVERDILLYYSRLSEDPGDPAPLDFEGLYARPYWECLDPEGMPPRRRDFFRAGCLVLMAETALDAMAGGVASPSHARLPLIRRALERLDERRDRMGRLANIARAFTEAAEAGGPMTEDLQRLSDELREDFVGGWFRERARALGGRPEKDAPAQTAAGVTALLRDIERAERAYERMYESGHPKDERDEALAGLAKAIEATRARGWTELEAALRRRCTDIEATFNSQFRGV